MNSPPPPSSPPKPHSRAEDIYAFCVGTSLIMMGLVILRAAGLVTAGIAGVALMLSYIFPLPLGLLFTLANLPFFLFGAWALGRAFAIKSFLVNLMISTASIIAARSITIGAIDPVFAAFVGGTAIGMGILAIARHGAGVGGTGIIALWLYKARGWNAGIVALAFDILVLAAGSLTVSPMRLLWSALSVLAIHAIVFAWHRPGRYTGY